MIVYLVIHFVCALTAAWLAIKLEYLNENCLYKHYFVQAVVLSLLFGPIALFVTVGTFLDWLDEYGSEDKIHFLDRFFKKEDKDD